LRFNKGLQIIGLFFIIVSIIAVVYASKIIMNRYNIISSVSSDTTSTSPSISSNATQTSQLVQLNQMQSNNIKKTSNNHNEYDVILPSGDGMPGYRSTYFTPTSLHIHSGDTVRWINKDTVSHTVTAIAFNSGLIWPSGSVYGQSSISFNSYRSSY